MGVGDSVGVGRGGNVGVDIAVGIGVGSGVSVGIAVGSGKGVEVEVDTGVGSSVGAGVDVDVGNGVAGRIAVGAFADVATGVGTGDVTGAACGSGSGSPVSPAQLMDTSMAATTNRAATLANRSSMIASGLPVAKMCLGGNGNTGNEVRTSNPFNVQQNCPPRNTNRRHIQRL